MEFLKSLTAKIDECKENLIKTQQEVATHEYDKKILEQSISQKKTEIANALDELYQLEQKKLHITEIVRLAEIQLPRLRRAVDNVLIPADIAELEKWLKRVKTMDGYISIIKALKRVQDFEASDVKNPYALIQKIIIEGPKNP